MLKIVAPVIMGLICSCRALIPDLRIICRLYSNSFLQHGSASSCSTWGRETIFAAAEFRHAFASAILKKETCFIMLTGFENIENVRLKLAVLFGHTRKNIVKK
jgi:hypothetical protein